MKPELSMRLQRVIPYMQNTLPLEEWWAMQDQFTSAKDFNHLPEATQKRVEEAETALSTIEQ